MGKKLIKKVDNAVKYIRKLDSSKHKREVYAILVNPTDCLEKWNLLSVPSAPTVVTVYRGYTVIACDKVEEGTVIVIHKTADPTVNFSKPQYFMPINLNKQI